jgi:hypothetical protein
MGPKDSAFACVTRHPDQDRMEQMARNVTMRGTGFLADCRYLLHDRNSNQMLFKSLPVIDFCRHG